MINADTPQLCFVEPQTPLANAPTSYENPGMPACCPDPLNTTFLRPETTDPLSGSLSKPTRPRPQPLDPPRHSTRHPLLCRPSHPRGISPRQFTLLRHSRLVILSGAQPCRTSSGSRASLPRSAHILWRALDKNGTHSKVSEQSPLAAYQEHYNTRSPVLRRSVLRRRRVSLAETQRSSLVRYAGPMGAACSSSRHAS
jgi:hypothetical protein